MSEFLEELLDGFDELDEKKSDTPEKDQMACPKCEAILDSDAVECYKCGASISAEGEVVEELALCKICDEEVPVDALRCPSCGTPVDMEFEHRKSESEGAEEEGTVPRKAETEEASESHDDCADTHQDMEDGANAIRDVEEVSKDAPAVEVEGVDVASKDRDKEYIEGKPQGDLSAFNALVEESGAVIEEPAVCEPVADGPEMEEENIAAVEEIPEAKIPEPAVPARVKKVKKVAVPPAQVDEKTKKKAEKLLKKGKLTQQEYDAMVGGGGNILKADKPAASEIDTERPSEEKFGAETAPETASVGSEDYLSSKERELSAQVQKLNEREEALATREKELARVEEELRKLSEAMDGQADGKEIIDLQAAILANILKKNSKIVLEVVKELNISTEDIRRLT